MKNEVELFLVLRREQNYLCRVMCVDVIENLGRSQ